MSRPNAQSLEARAAESERSISSRSSSDAALESAIRSAELYMQALRLSGNPRERVRLDAKCKELLAKAESIKAGQDASPAAATVPVRSQHPGPISSRKLTTRENIIILEGSKLNGFVFKPWLQPPSPSEFELRNGDDPYLEDPPLSLSADQMRSFNGWKRPTQALGDIKISINGASLPATPIMALPGKIDLVQDMASDCSVVASLCAGTARAERGHPRILGQIVYPYDYGENHVKISPNGHYILRLYFNGCWRRVDIDDMLPTSKTSRVLHVVDRSHPGLLWPVLIEKAYLKVRGGYDFPGSNSGTDIEVLSGWIPQQIFLHDEDVEPNSLWTELYNAFEKGDILLTIGTGKLPPREQKQLGLAAEHDYAILDMKMNGDVKEMLIKNPWSDGDVWKGATRRRPNPSHEYDEPLSPTTQETIEMLPGTFWMEFNNVFQYFENMYVNWNPGLFQHREDMHFPWNVTDTPSVPNIFADNPQFQVRTKQVEEVWILLNRHFRTGDYTHQNSNKNGYISLYIYEKQGYRMLSTEGATIRGPFVDSPYTLVRFPAKAHRSYTVVVVAQDLPVGKHNFTLSLFSQSPMLLQKAPSLYDHYTSVESAWNRTTSGGNSDSPRYLENPQFSFSIVARDTLVAIALRLLSDSSDAVGQTNVHVKLLLLHSPVQGIHNASDLGAHRIIKLRTRDIMTSSGDYRRGSAVIDTVLGPGVYTLICSTFNENQQAKFVIGLYTSSPSRPQLRPVPAEGGGRLRVGSGPVIFEPGTSRMTASLSVPRISKAFFKASPSRTTQGRPDQASWLCKFSLEQGRGPYRTTIATSAAGDAEFHSVANGLRIEDVDLQPSSHVAEGWWLVLERSSQGPSQNTNASLEIEVFTEERVEIGSWEAVDV